MKAFVFWQVQATKCTSIEICAFYRGQQYFFTWTKLFLGSALTVRLILSQAWIGVVGGSSVVKPTWSIKHQFGISRRGHTRMGLHVIIGQFVSPFNKHISEGSGFFFKFRVKFFATACGLGWLRLVLAVAKEALASSWWWIVVVWNVRLWSGMKEFTKKTRLTHGPVTSSFHICSRD